MSLAKRRPERPPTKLDVQLDLIVSAFREKGIDIGVALFPGGGLDFIYQRGVILVRDAYLGQVRDIVGGGDTGDGFRGGVTPYSLAHAKIRDVIAALAEIDRSLGIGSRHRTTSCRSPRSGRARLPSRRRCRPACGPIPSPAGAAAGECSST